jgi:hypothetical protein
MRKLREILQTGVGTTSLVVALTSCSEPTAFGCNLNGVPPISVDVHDIVTALPAAYSASLTLTLGTETGTYEPTFRATDSLSAVRIEGRVLEFLSRPGVYDVRVERPGYEPWLRNDVVVADQGDRCVTIEPVVLNVLLVRSNAITESAGGRQRR